ncbi:MAG: tetratricopeptide repeat protein [Chloroflexi bacterium]|nr:tetratricopeptide repeat protein [Chloroflexota bacterium]
MSERKNLEQSISTLEAQRALLGDAIVNTALAPMREKLAALKAQAELPAQKRKQITVLFADVSGFTALSETLDAEEVGDVMNDLWRRIDGVIEALGGVIDKHIGDAVMALWGGDRAREDDPERAVRAALGMQTGVVAFQEERGIQLAMRVGLNTGPVLLGEVSTGEFTAMGDTVNLASRMEHAAPVGGILITHDTYQHVRGLFDVQPQDLLQVKGKTKPVQTYTVQRARLRPFRMTTRGIEGIETHMVGRNAELLILQNAFHDVIEDAETRVVTIAGEAGVGKSRLLHEFDSWIKSPSSRGKLDQIARLKSRTTPEMQSIPYSIIREMFAYHFDIRESDSPATALEKFRAGMAHMLEPDQADLVGHFVGFDFSASPAVQNLLGSLSFGKLATAYLTNYIRVLSNEPIVIFLDDIHWADDSSLDLVDHIVTAIPKAQLLIVCLTRLRFFERRPDWGKGRNAFTQINLRPLSKRDSRTLVSDILQKVDHLPDDLRNLIVDSAEGNPFYVEELVKILIEDGVIVRGKAEWHTVLDCLEEVCVPSTLTGIIQARLDSLPRQEKMLLQRASVVGRQFWDATVAELRVGDTDWLDHDEIVSLLDAVHSRELIFRRERSAFEGTGEYIFKHSTLRDVTYETVLLKLRRVHHAQVARWLEVNAGERLDEYLNLIAGHYELAGERAKAADYLRRSGEEALRASTFRDAIGAFERALAMTPESDVASYASLLVRLGNAYYRVSDYPLATQHFEEGLTLARQVDVPQTEIMACIGLGRVASYQGEYDEAERHLAKGFELACECDDSRGRALAVRVLSEVYFRQGDFAKADEYAKQGLEISKRLNDRQGTASTLRTLSTTARTRGEYKEAERYLEESLALLREIGDRPGVARCLNNLGEIARIQAKYEEAARYYDESLVIAKDVDLRMVIAACLINLGLVHASLGKNDVSSKYLHEALEKSVTIGVVPIALFALTGIAELQTRARRYVWAAELLGLVLGHPAMDAQNKQETKPTLSVLREALPASELETALERGKSLELEVVVAELLGGTKK